VLANFVRTFGLNPNIYTPSQTEVCFGDPVSPFPETQESHDWHVQPSCQRPNRNLRLSGAFQSSRIHKESSRPRNLLKISFCSGSVNRLISQDFHMSRSKTHLPSRSSAGFPLGDKN